VALRSRTDRAVSAAWILLPIVDIAIALAAFAFAFITFFQAFRDFRPPFQPSPFDSGFFLPFTGAFLFVQVVQIVVAASFAYLIYLLVRRRNEHFARQNRLMNSLISTIREVQVKKGISVEINLSSADRTMRETQFEEGEKSAVLWAILVFLIGIPVLGLVGVIALLYVFYFLGRDWRRHEQREDLYFQDVERACSPLGIAFTLRRLERIPNRSFALYLIATIFTLGIFGIYWLYTLIVDPNNHFRTHVGFEDGLVGGLASALA